MTLAANVQRLFVCSASTVHKGAQELLLLLACIAIRVLRRAMPPAEWPTQHSATRRDACWSGGEEGIWLRRRAGNGDVDDSDGDGDGDGHNERQRVTTTAAAAAAPVCPWVHVESENERERDRELELFRKSARRAEALGLRKLLGAV